MTTADHAEAASIRRFHQMSDLRNAIDEASRRADAHLRLEHALRYSVRPESSERSTARRAA